MEVVTRVEESAGGTPGTRADDADRRVLERVAAGDADAFADLVERHQGRLLRVCRRMLGDPEEARDAAQEVFLKAYRKAGTFEPRGKVYTWLYRIAVNHCLNLLRRRRVVRFLQLGGGGGEGGEEEVPLPEPVDDAADPEAALEARRRWRRARRAVAELPANQRAVLVLARFEGLAYKEIAEVLGVSVSAVESRLFRAMRNLESALKETEDDGGER